MEAKRRAAEAAVALVEDGMVLGLGTGSTVRYALEAVSRLVAEGWDLLGIPTSEATEALARSLGIPLTTLDDHPEVDLTVDGADEVDPGLDLIKGLGGALFREKVVAVASATLTVAVDDTKLVDFLGQRAPLPVEVLPFGLRRTRERVEALGCEATLRTEDGRPFVTDNGNHLLHCRFRRIDAPVELGRRLKDIPGVLEHGLFLGLAQVAFVGSAGGVREMRRPRPAAPGPG